MIDFPDQEQQVAVIKVIGLGGGGCNAVDSMVSAGLDSINCIVANTDKQALSRSRTPYRIQLGESLTNGLGSGGKPEIGEKATQESKEALQAALEGADLVFIAAGMGGGTGTGAAPIVADIVREMGGLSIAVVTKPFSFEGRERIKVAEAGAQRLKTKADAVMIVPNDHLLQNHGEKLSILESFEVANRVLQQAVLSIYELINVPGKINVDFSDIRSIFGSTGGAIIGIGNGKGENRAEQAFRKASSSPLLEKTEIQGAKRILLNVTGGTDLSLVEISTIAQLANDLAHPDAQVRIGTVIDDSITDEVRVTLIATGFDGSSVSATADYVAKSFSRPVPVVAPVPEPVVVQAAPAPEPVPEPEPEPEENKEPEFEPDGQMSLIAAIQRHAQEEHQAKEASTNKDKANPEGSESNDWDIPAFKRMKNLGLM
jgi:cell division protein FtsZ